MRRLAALEIGLSCLVCWLTLGPGLALAAPDPKTTKPADGRPPPELAADPRALMKWRYQQILEGKANLSGIYTVRSALFELAERYDKTAKEYNAKGEPEPAKQAALAANLARWYSRQVALLDQILSYHNLESQLHQNANYTPAQRVELLNQAKTEMPRLLGELKQIYEQPPNR